MTEALSPGALPCRIAVPPRLAAGAPVLVAVHGISRNQAEVAAAFAPAATAAGAILLVPAFARTEFPGYQWLAPHAGAPRADLALIAAIGALRARLPQAGPLLLFGHSGGGQFVHRFVMAWPELVARYVVSAAGWYTWPESPAPFPAGIGTNPLLPDISPRPERFLRVPGAVFVGVRDTRRGRTLNTAPAIDAVQGPDRRRRARAFVAAMNARAAALALPPPLRLAELPEAAHLFSGLVARGGIVGRTLAALGLADQAETGCRGAA